MHWRTASAITITGIFSQIAFDCCPDAVSEGKFLPGQLSNLKDLETAMQDLYDAERNCRKRMTDETARLTELMDQMLSERAQEEKKAIDRRDQYANGLSGFLMSQMQAGIQAQIIQAFRMMGYPLNPAQIGALNAFSTAVTNAAGAMGNGGGLGSVSGASVQMMIDAALADMPENDRKALGFVSNAVFSQIASAIVEQAIGEAVESSVGNFLLKGAGEAALPLTLLDRMITIAPYLWEDKNRMILEGAFDRIILGLLQGVRLTESTGRFADEGPLRAYLDALKGPKERAIEICLPEQTIDPPTAQNMKDAFFRAAFPDAYVESLSANERFEVVANGDKPYLEYIFENRIRIHARFGCYCGKLQEKIAQQAEPTNGPWSQIDLTDPRMKPGYPFAPHAFPWIPVSGGVAGAAIITTVVLANSHKSQDCNFFVSVQTSAATCGRANGSAVISVTPGDGYDYLWSNGSAATSLTTLPAGPYSVTVTRSGTSCTRVIDFTIENVDITFSATVGSNPATCGMSDGAAYVDVDPPGSYSYLWSNGGMGNMQTNLAAGAYMVTTSAGGACKVVQSITVEELPPQFQIDITSTPAHCGSSDGTATALASPAGNYAYLWSTGATGQQLTGVPTGQYQVTVTIAGTSCNRTSEVTVGEDPALFMLSTTSTDAGCGLSNGSATVTADPPDTYIYEWSNGATTAGITGVPAGQYSVTVTREGTACAKSVTVTVAEMPAGFGVSLTTTAATCGINDGSATALADPPDNYTYQWSNGSTTTAINSVDAGDYTVTVTDSGGCSSTATATVPENPADYIVSVTPVPGNCLGEGANIMITVQTPGTGPLQIVATDPQGHPNMVTTIPGTVSLKGFFTIIPGSWTLTVTDLSLPGRCSDNATVVVADNTVFSPLEDAYETTTDQPVSGNLLDNDTGTSLTITDHTTPSGGTLTVNADGSFTFTPPPGEMGTYTFMYTVADACGHSMSVNVTITVNGTDCLFDVTVTTTPAHCGLQNGAITLMPVPPGTYTYAWSDGATDQNRVDIAAGTYQVTVTSVALMCSHEYSADVTEVPNTYITDITTSPGNCTGEGNILITLQTPGEGPLIVIVDGPGGSVELTLDPGQHDLSSSMNIPSGDYTITVYDEGAGESCAETMTVTVPDNTPALVATDDAYQTDYETPISGNVLDNDGGLGLTLTNVTAEVGGTVDFNADGSFTYTPDQGFSGIGSFEYTVTDACGNTATAFVEITVAEVVCDFTVQFVNTNASCGLVDGSASVVVDPPGAYLYDWSNGDTGPMLSDVSAGMYSVTIEDVNLGCSLTFDTEIGEDPAQYISNVQVTQPVCPDNGEITFDVSSPSGGPFEITVMHPNGIDVFDVPEGTVTLSEFIEIASGDYSVSVTDVNAGPDCVDSFVATIDPATMVEIMVVEVIPPTDFSSSDGAIIVDITMTGVAPYTILLNGLIWGVTTDLEFTIDGLISGDFTVQVQDANGCLSNLVEVTVPPPGGGLQFGFGITTLSVPQPEHPAVERTIVTSYIDASWRYPIAGIGQESRVMMIPHGDGNAFRFSQMMGIWEHHTGSMTLGLNGGVSADVLRDVPVAQHWELQGRVSKRIGKVMTISGSISLRGWGLVKRPGIELGFRLSLCPL